MSYIINVCSIKKQFQQPCGGGGGGAGGVTSQYMSSHAPPMSLPCMTTTEPNKECIVPSCAQDDFFNKLENDKLK